LPTLLRSRLAAAVLVAIFLIPVGLLTLRGLTHVVSCEARVEQPFQVVFSGGQPVLTGSTVVRPDEEALCGVLDAGLSVSSPGPNRLDITVPLTNLSDQDWHGTVELAVGQTQVPVPIGLVPAQGSRTEVVRLRLPDGTTQVDGSLLIGP
jgi:hypothetical protein